MERDDIGIYIVVAAIIALLVGVLAFWFYAELTCFARGCTGGAGPGNEPDASTAPLVQTRVTTEWSVHPGQGLEQVSIRVARHPVAVMLLNTVS